MPKVSRSIELVHGTAALAWLRGAKADASEAGLNETELCVDIFPHGSGRLNRENVLELRRGLNRFLSDTATGSKKKK